MFSKPPLVGVEFPFLVCDQALLWGLWCCNILTFFFFFENYEPRISASKTGRVGRLYFIIISRSASKERPTEEGKLAILARKKGETERACEGLFFQQKKIVQEPDEPVLRLLCEIIEYIKFRTRLGRAPDALALICVHTGSTIPLCDNCYWVRPDLLSQQCSRGNTDRNCLHCLSLLPPPLSPPPGSLSVRGPPLFQ